MRELNFAAVSEPTVSTQNVKRGAVVKVQGMRGPQHVLRRSGLHVWVKPYEGSIRTRRNAHVDGSYPSTGRKASVRAITHVAISGRRTRRPRRAW